MIKPALRIETVKATMPAKSVKSEKICANLCLPKGYLRLKMQETAKKCKKSYVFDEKKTKTSSTTVEDSLQISLCFLQNKPNFPRFSPENEDLTQKQTQFKPNSKPKQTQFTKRLKMNITIYDTREYRNETVVRRKKANPIKANNQLSACAIGMSFIMIYFNFIEEFTTLMGDGIIFLTYAFLSDIIRNRRENEYYRGVVLDPWLETAGVVLVAFVGIFLGKVFSCLRKSYWLLGYFLPFSLVIIMVLARSIDSLYFVWPFSWIVTGRVKFVVLCFAVSMGLTVPLSRLPRRCERILVCVLMISVVFWYTVLPFLVPALIREHLSNIQTRLSYNGVCFQSTDFTCGPAAAVTALGKLGLPAEEGELAVLSHTSPVAGTLPACLSSALKKRYGADGLKCRYRHFDSIDQLKKAGITLVMVRDSFLLDHCLAVLDVSDSTITIADPMSGLIKMPRERFKKIWRFSGIVLRRDRSQSI